MEHLQYPTEEVRQGPFVIDVDHLKKLDELLEEHWAKLEEWHTRNVDEITDRRVESQPTKRHEDMDRDQIRAEIADSYEWKKSERKLTIGFKGGKKAESQTAKKLLARPDLAELVPEWFSLELTQGPITIKMESTYLASSTHGYSVSTNAQVNIAHEAKSAFGRWLGEITPKLWVRLWSKMTWAFPLQWGLFFLLLLVFFAVQTGADSPTEAARQQYQSRLRDAAAVLLEDGTLAEEELAEAARISLELATEYLPPDTELPARRVPKTWLWIIGVSLLLASILSFRPRFELAIGRGSRRVRIWKRWLRFVGYTLPIGALTYVGLPWLAWFLWG